MINVDVIQFSAAFFFGVLSGGCYFGGLWWTVRRLPRTPRVWRLYFSSLLIRLALLLSSFCFVLTYYDWQSLAACLLGVVAIRLLLTRMLGRARPALPFERATL